MNRIPSRSRRQEEEMSGPHKSAVDAELPSRRQVLGSAAAAGLAMTSFAGPVLAAALTNPFTYERFQRLLNQGFTVSGGDIRATLRLIEVEVHPRGVRPAQLRDPFSLVFRASSGETLPAGIYAVEQPTLGRVEMFLTPVSPDSSIYEAAFN
jgi:hypothetical protein